MNRELLGEEFYLVCLKDYESLRVYRNKISAKELSEAEKLILKMNKGWESWYRKILFNA